MAKGSLGKCPDSPERTLLAYSKSVEVGKGSESRKNFDL